MAEQTNMSKLQQASMYPFLKGDYLARRYTRSTSYWWAKDHGASESQAMQAARDADRRAHFDYSTTDAINAITKSPLRQLLGKFQTYRIKQFETWSRMTPAQFGKSFLNLLALTGLSGVTFGLLGHPKDQHPGTLMDIINHGPINGPLGVHVIHSPMQSLPGPQPWQHWYDLAPAISMGVNAGKALVDTGKKLIGGGKQKTWEQILNEQPISEVRQLGHALLGPNLTPLQRVLHGLGGSAIPAGKGSQGHVRAPRIPHLR